MSPLYDYECAAGHRSTDLRPMADRRLPIACTECGEPSGLVMSRPHCRPSGEYSYEPNIGDPDKFERQQAKIRGEIPNDWEGQRG